MLHSEPSLTLLDKGLVDWRDLLGKHSWGCVQVKAGSVGFTEALQRLGKTFGNLRPRLVGGRWVEDTSDLAGGVTDWSFPQCSERRPPAEERRWHLRSSSRSGGPGRAADLGSSSGHPEVEEAVAADEILDRPGHRHSSWMNYWCSLAPGELAEKLGDRKGAWAAWLFWNREHGKESQYEDLLTRDNLSVYT